MDGLKTSFTVLFPNPRLLSHLIPCVRVCMRKQGVKLLVYSAAAPYGPAHQLDM